MSSRAIGCWKLSLGMLIVPSPLVGAVPSLAMATSTYMPSGRASAFTPLIVSSGTAGPGVVTKTVSTIRVTMVILVVALSPLLSPEPLVVAAAGSQTAIPPTWTPVVTSAGTFTSNGTSTLEPGGTSTLARDSWIQLSRASVEVPPGSSVEVPFEVKVPADVTTGVHVGGIAVWEPAAATTSGSGESSGDKATTKITMVTRMVLTVFVTTPGPAVPELTISGVKAEARPDGMYVLVAIANDGTAPTSGEGTISMPSESFQQPIALEDMVPVASTGYPIKWKTDPAAGTYQAEVEIRYADGSKVAKWSGSFTVADKNLAELKDRAVPGEKPPVAGRPWLMYGLIGGLVLVVIIMGFALLRRRQPDSSS